MPTTLLQQEPLSHVVAGLRDSAWRDALQAAQDVSLPAGTVVFRDGDACRHYLLVASGKVRVQKVAENGREIVLYRVGPGESCVLTTSCLLADEHYPAEGVTETAVEAVAIPAVQFRTCLRQSEAFRNFVFNLYGRRIRDLLMLVENVAFGRIDVRLAHWLLTRAGNTPQLTCTHQEIAAELGTAREVVSRQLKTLEQNGLLRVTRGHIELMQPERLRELAGRNSE